MKSINDTYEYGPFVNGCWCIDWPEYQRTMDIFDRVYKWYGMDKKKMKTPFHYSVYEWLTKIISIVTGNFWVWNDNKSSKYTVRIPSRYCKEVHKEEFKNLWNDILDVIERHMNKLYEDVPVQDGNYGNWYQPNRF